MREICTSGSDWGCQHKGNSPRLASTNQPNDLQLFEQFYASLVQKKYKASHKKSQLVARTKIKIDTIALEEVIAEFEKKLQEDPSENVWGEFLKKNLYLLDSKYVKVIPQLNVVLSGSRNVDFGLIDSQGYLDLFEIKKPSIPLLSKTTDRGNFYWSTEAIKAITQVEKYLFNAERKAANLAEDIIREEQIKDIMLKVIKPRAFVIMGSSSQLDTSEKETDFRILRTSLKNVEIVLYDELIERLKNQKNKIF
jgi:hypothetical protein